MLCFLHHTPGDLLLAGHKIVGSAQRKQRGAILQHGGILLAQSPHTPALPGIAELSDLPLSAEQVQDAIVDALQSTMGWTIEPDTWTEAEQATLADQLSSRYLQATWNEKR